MSGRSRFVDLARFKRLGLLPALLTVVALSADGFVHSGSAQDDFSDADICVSCQLGQFVAPDGLSEHTALHHPPESLLPLDFPAAASTQAIERLANPTRAPPA